MRLDSVFSEAARNVAARTSRPVVSLILFIALIGGLALFDVTAINGVLAKNAAFTSSGASTTTLTATGQVGGMACDNLANAPRVRAAGAVADTQPLVFSSLPSSPVPTKRASPGFLALLPHEVDTSQTGIFVSHDLAVTLSVTTGDSVDTKNGPVRVEGVYDYPDDGRAPGLGYAAIFIEPVTASTMFDACWMDAPYPAEDTRSLIWTSVETIGQAAKPTLGQLNSTMGVSFDAISAFNSRPSESFPWVALLLGSVVGFVPVRFRRLELASALHSRIPKAGLTLQVMLENLFWLIPAVLVVSGASLFLSQTALESDFISIASAGFRIVGLGSIGVLLGSIVGVLVTRERDLFKYFKER